MTKILGLLIVNFITALILSFFVSIVTFISDLRNLIVIIVAGNLTITAALFLTSLTAFLEAGRSGLRNWFLSFLSFFLVPVAASVLFLRNSSDSDFTFYLINVICFHISLFLHFLIYRSARKRN
jgi:hypothetical protein